MKRTQETEGTKGTGCAATRHICVGTVYREGRLVERGQLRTQKCLSVNWRGQTDAFQPRQFLEERQLLAAVRGRLAMAGLALIKAEIGKAESRNEYAPIRCVVGRLRRPHSRAVQENRMRQSWKRALTPEESQAATEAEADRLSGMTEAEMQSAMAEVALAFGQREEAL